MEKCSDHIENSKAKREHTGFNWMIFIKKRWKMCFCLCFRRDLFQWGGICVFRQRKKEKEMPLRLWGLYKLRSGILVKMMVHKRDIVKSHKI